ncbi:MAG: VWA domain-containing protein [Alphaproteobacteria bacterium]|nr:VWA domain-containing protein [Alphaproteobacteria bacterium]
MSGEKGGLPANKTEAAVDAFLRQVAALPAVHAGAGRGRLIFALDATMSRQPTWDRAVEIQADMFRETATIGGLNIQVVFFRGLGEFETTPWSARPEDLATRMVGISCRGGKTQIGRVLLHATAEARAGKIAAMVYVGDCCEEDGDRLCKLAGELGLLGVPAFIFQEGDDAGARAVFQEIARLTKGAYSRFDAGSAQQLRELLRAVAVYAAGGRKALADLGKRQGGAALLLLGQMK